MLDDNATGPCLTGVEIHEGIDAPSDRQLAQKGYVRYSVKFEAPGAGGNRRRSKRRDVRLQSGKVLDEKERFLVDCLFRDRTEAGCQLRLCKNLRVPNRIRVYDDVSQTTVMALIVWRRGYDVGCRFVGREAAASDRLVKRMKGPYYAI